MSIIINLKRGIIEFKNLNDDCNFILNSNDIKHSLNYIDWNVSELKLLCKYKFINWEIYSYRDITKKIINEFLIQFLKNYIGV